MINTPRIVHETINDEVIIIDFDNGAYFSTDAIGAVIWGQITKNVSVNDMIHTLTQSYQGDVSDIEKSVEQFLTELQQEALIVELSKASSLLENIFSLEQDSSSRSVFQAPVLHKYTDMQDLLLLDPIHEVDTQGWPLKKM